MPRPEWKGKRVQTRLVLPPDALKMLKTLARRQRVAQSELLEEWIRRAWAERSTD